MDKVDLLKAVHARMDAEGLSQRELAAHLGTTQGHLSKVLRGLYSRPSRVVRELERYAEAGRNKAASACLSAADAEGALLQAARGVAGGDHQVMHQLVELMHFLGRFRSS
jgi:transcriptional regulator with XRE-family HTH domain